MQKTLGSAIRQAFNFTVAQLPVIGPHAGIEPALLLSGDKRMGWLPVLTDPDVIKRVIGSARLEYDNQKKLDDAVTAGRLKSCDVIQKQENLHEITIRHYCQPQYEAEMLLIAAINEKLFNREHPATALQKSFGDYLGYRKRDQLLWTILPSLPNPL